VIASRWNSFRESGIKILWALLFFTLPVTSFPYIPTELGGKTLVRPLSMYPLIALVILVTLPRLFKRPLPRTLLPLLAFILVAFLSSLMSFSTELEGLLGISAADRMVRNLATLGLGVAFYLTVILLIKEKKDIEFSLRWLYAGFGLALLWGSAQALYILHFNSIYFRLLNQIQSLISTRKLFNNRISGLTYEPKWFAEQICFLLLPWLLGAVISKRSLFRWRFKWITVEWVMLAWATGILFFTFSRTGLFLAVGLYVVSFLIVRAASHQAKVKPESQSGGVRRKLILETLLLVVSLVTIIVIVGSQNPYFSRLWRYWTEAKSRNRTYLEYIAFQQRFVYWETAFNMFDEQPLLGVGLGNYAFYFKDALPAQFYRLPEIVRQITPTEGRDRLITPKNLPARLLAETGILGLMTFLSFTLAVLGCALRLYFYRRPDAEYIGVGSLLSMVVFVIIIFSFDSFAIPNMWIAFGLITAAAHLPDASQNPPVEA
jgi:hypothetical protein